MERRILLSVVACLITYCATDVLVAQESGKADEGNISGVGIKDGWRNEIEIPEVKGLNGDTFLRSAKVVLWVEHGWVCARRTDADGATEWQVVLAQPMTDAAPVIEVDKTGGLEIAYGRYFIRENFGRLRILRQRKDAQAPNWPRMEMSQPIESTLGSGAMPTKLVELRACIRGDWCWVSSGPRNDRPDIWLRLERKELGKPGYGFESGPKPVRMFFGDHHAIDEGDLFIATRSPAEVSEQVLAARKLRETLGTKPAPAVVASKWFNSREALLVDKLHGKVVLLDFWGTWCRPCVEKLPAIEALHKKYGERGLIVIGVHSEQGGDTVASFLEKKPVSFPIAVDTGETAKSYGVNSWPTYFLIDKSGTTKWGFSSSPPSDSQIEELLR